MLRFVRRALASFGVLFLVSTAVAIPPAAAQSTTSISGVVRDARNAPVNGATVTVSGQGITVKAQTDVQGRFAFPALAVGKYRVTADKDDLHASQDIDLTSSGAVLAIAVAPLQTIGRTVVSRSPLATRSASDVTLNAQQLQSLPGGRVLPDILTQLPSAARGSNGQIHINGDHNGINYYLNGVQIPASLNRVLGGEFDPTNIGFLEAIEGAYPAQYGDRFATILLIGSRTFTGPPGAGILVQGGSYGSFDSTLDFHAPIGDGGSLSFSSRFARSDLALDPAVLDAPHNAGSNSNQSLHVSLPVAGGHDLVSLDMINSYQTYQVPPDTALGVPATTDDNELQSDFFTSLQYRHAIGDRGSLSFGPSFKYSRILDTNDLANDLAGGAGTTCTDFSDCQFFSVFADRSSRDYRFNVDYALRSDHHEIRTGVLYGVTNVPKNYAITLQPGNALSPTGGPFTALDTSPNVAHQQEAYIQDSWRMGSYWRLDYGLRYDAFQIFSTDFNNGFAQFSPRIKLTLDISPRSSAYVYFGRLFVPFSFENVSPATAAELYVPANNPGLSNDLKPQRDSLYELGFHFPVGSSDVGLRLSHKSSTDYIDDTQVGSTNLHQDINFPRGQVELQTLYVQRPLERNGRFYFSVTHSQAVTSANCETQLLQNCALAGPPGGDWVQADHDQRWEAVSGVLLNDHRGGWFALTGEYGSGLSTDPASCTPVNAVYCKVAPHLTFGFSKGVPLGGGTTAALIVQNLFNDRYAITLNNNLQGTHYAAGRVIQLQFRHTIR
jgi:hypothetical protein